MGKNGPGQRMQTFLLILELQDTFSEALRQVKTQQIKVKFWICGPIKVYYNMTCAQNIFQKSLHPILQQHIYHFKHAANMLEDKNVFLAEK